LLEKLVGETRVYLEGTRFDRGEDRGEVGPWGRHDKREAGIEEVHIE
jgi:hypothetical protein